MRARQEQQVVEFETENRRFFADYAEVEQQNANLANLYYVPFAPHMVASFLGAMASCHVCASVPNFMILEWQTYFDTQPMWKEMVTYDGPWVEKGFIRVSDKPGIGVDINEEGMRKYAVANVPFFA